MKRIPRTVWALGAVSLCMDLSSELVHSLLPVYLTVVLGAGMAAVGLVEGIAEATASIVKVFSGALSDRLGHRKPLVVLGYALAALSKPLFPLAESVPLVLAARFMDRIGKGIRGAPRDALIADVTPAHVRGAAYGLRQALDTVGAVLGPLAAIGLMLWLADDIRSVLNGVCGRQQGESTEYRRTVFPADGDALAEQAPRLHVHGPGVSGESCFCHLGSGETR